jgi:hypothetical protein
MNARAWFATQSFHHLPEETPVTPAPDLRAFRRPLAEAPLETYDTPWGPKVIALCEHEASIGGDGYGGRCCGTMDAPVIHEADPDCARHLCESCCDDTCCRACHAVSVVEDAEYCAACQVDQEMARRADEDLDRQPMRLDDRSAADKFYDRWKAAREEGR